MNKFKAGILVTITGLAFAGAATAVQAADSIEEVVVTATKRASTIQDVPFSINAQSEEALRRSGVSNIEELSRNVAGLTVQNLGPGQSQVAVRGVSAGQIVRDQPGVKEQVGVYLDESVVSLSLFTPDFDLYDLNRVETLRGPQGTLFGSGSVGGTIRYITNQPTLDQEEASIEFDMNTVTNGGDGGHFKGMINIPTGEDTALRIVAYSTQYAGFIDALRPTGKTSDVNYGDRTGIRAALRWEAASYLAITPRLVFQSVRAQGFNRQEVFNALANPHTTTPTYLGEREQYLLHDESFEDNTAMFDITAEGSLGGFDFTYIASLLSRDILVSRDASALTGSVSVDLGFPHTAVALPSNLRDTTDLSQFTQEFRINSNDDAPMQWLAGLFMSDVDRNYRQRLPTPGYDQVLDQVEGAGKSDSLRNGFAEVDSPYNSYLPYNIEQLALFGELSFELSDRVDLTLGGRWYSFEESRSFTSGGRFSNRDAKDDYTDSRGFTPRALVAFDVNDNVIWNAQISRGFRLGGVNDPLNLTICDEEDKKVFNTGDFDTYEDETTWNYETGFKAAWNNGVRFNLALFRTDISNLQVNLDTGSCSSRLSINIPGAHTTGLEFEVTAEPRDGLLLSFAGSMLESEFDDSVLIPKYGLVDGNRLASVPELQLAASATYNFPIDLFGGSDAYFSATIHHVGNRITQPGDQQAGAGNFISELAYGGATGTEVTALDLELDPYTIINLRLGVQFDVWDTAFYINNATDENASLSFDRERGGRARLAFRTNQPRTIGLMFRRDFL